MAHKDLCHDLHLCSSFTCTWTCFFLFLSSGLVQFRPKQFLQSAGLNPRAVPPYTGFTDSTVTTSELPAQSSTLTLDWSLLDHLPHFLLVSSLHCRKCSAVALLLSGLSGSFVPSSSSPRQLATLAALLVSAWTFRGFTYVPP